MLSAWLQPLCQNPHAHRLINFFLDVEEHMSIVVELQLHLRGIYELKVRSPDVAMVSYHDI